jgi:hypothetical protein
MAMQLSDSRIATFHLSLGNRRYAMSANTTKHASEYQNPYVVQRVGPDGGREAAQREYRRKSEPRNPAKDERLERERLAERANVMPSAEYR